MITPTSIGEPAQGEGDRLARLSAAATQGEWSVHPFLEFADLFFIEGGGGNLADDVSPDDGAFVCALVNGYRSGALIAAPTPYGRSGRQDGETREEGSTNGEHTGGDGFPPYRPEAVYLPEADAAEYVLRDCACIYEEIDHGAALIRDMGTREVIGFRIQAPAVWATSLGAPCREHASREDAPAAEVRRTADTVAEGRAEGEAPSLLREAIARTVYERAAKRSPYAWTPWERMGPKWQAQWFEEADALFSGPLADLLSRLTTLKAERDEARALLRRAEQRIRNQRLALRENWQVTEARVGSRARVGLFKLAQKRSVELAVAHGRIASLEARLGEALIVRNEAGDVLTDPDTGEPITWPQRYHATRAAMSHAKRRAENAEARLWEAATVVDRSIQHFLGIPSGYIDPTVRSTVVTALRDVRAAPPFRTLHDAVTKERGSE